MAIIQSNTFSIKRGTGKIYIHSTEFTGADTCEVMTIGALKWQNEVPERTDSDASSIQSLPGTIKISIHDELDSGTSLASELALLTVNAFARLEITQSPSGEVFKFPLVLKPNNFGLDQDSKNVEINLTPADSINQNLYGLSGGLSVSNMVTGTTMSPYHYFYAPLATADARVAGAGQTGFTINIDNGSGGAIAAAPSAGDVLYFATTVNDWYTATPYIVASATTTAITFENEVLTAPDDNAYIIPRDFWSEIQATGGLAQTPFLQSSEFVKYALEDFYLLYGASGQSFWDFYDFDTIIRSGQVSSSNTNKVFRFYEVGTLGALLDFYLGIINDSSANSVYPSLSRLAALHGALYGSGFSKNWFVHKLDQTDKVTLTLDDVSELLTQKSTINFRTITDLAYSVSISGENTFSSITSTATDTNNSENTFTAAFRVINMAWLDDLGSIDVTTNRVEHNLAPSNALRQGLTDNGFDSYWIQKGHESSASFNKIHADYFDTSEAIKIKVFNVFKILPYQCFDFDTSVDTQFQGKVFRPTQFNYDFIEDEIEILAYRIA